MRQQDLRSSWRSDFIRHRFDAHVQEQPDGIVVRTPSNPTYFWGNCPVWPQASQDQDLAFCLGRFDDLFGRHPRPSQHADMGVDAECQCEALPNSHWHLQRNALADRCA
jgi:hypothetical protein